MQNQPSDATVPLHEILAEVLARDPAAGGFEVQYQPIVRFAEQATVAVEALPCWLHPSVGEVAPSQFVAAAERMGLSAVVDDFVLNQACADAHAMTAAYGLDVPVHVNITARRLVRPDLHAAIEWALHRYKLTASRLVLEIADAGSAEDVPAATRSLQRIRDRGVRVALDNFGLGYDIMSRLQALPIDQIKLDATVTGAGVDAARTEAMCQAVLDICRRIGLEVIAQGIATAPQAAALQGMGCELGQGDLYGPPLRLQRRIRNLGSAVRKNG
jgi:EAL domain-containing protein (putative c-di-GMP-specific phosphodiesterase class I)